MIGVFEERRTSVRALQLRPDTAAELCRWAHGWRPDPYACEAMGQPGALLVLIKTTRGEQYAHHGDWVVQAQGNGGGFQILSPDRFNDKYSEVSPA